MCVCVCVCAMCVCVCVCVCYKSLQQYDFKGYTIAGNIPHTPPMLGGWLVTTNLSFRDESNWEEAGGGGGRVDVSLAKASQINQCCYGAHWLHETANNLRYFLLLGHSNSERGRKNQTLIISTAPTN